MRKLKLLMAAAAIMLGGGLNANAYSTSDLTSAGWTQVTESAITNVEANYYMLVDCNSSNYVMAAQADHFRPCYKTIDDPIANPSFVWILEGSDNEYNLKSYSTGAYFKQASGWNTSVGNARDGRTKVTGEFELSDGKYTLKCKESGSFIGHWNDNGAAVANDGEDIAANKQAKDAPGFYLYSIARTTFDAALVASRQTLVSSATKESPADVTSYIQNADWSGDWGGWESTFTSSGNIQWGQQTLESWNASNVIIKQELRGVPNGSYRVTADVISGPSATKAAYVYGIGTSKVSSDIVSAEASADNYSTMSSEVARKTLTADNIVVTNNTITIGIDQSTGWIVADNFKLYYLGVDLEEFINAYNTALTTAQGYEGKLFDEDWATLSEVISANTINTASATQDELTTATANLNAANEVASVAAAKYTTYNTANTLINGGENVDLTSLIVNPSFENSLTGWTNTGGMVTQNNTSFLKTGSNYCEFWQPNGTKGVSQTIGVLPAGLYSITVRVKARGVTSAKIFAAGIDQAVTIEDSENEYTVNFALDDKGEALIGFEGVGTGAGSSWFALDNFRLTYVGGLPASLTAATGNMNATVSDDQASAVDAYNSNQTVANYNAAVAAIAAAEASIAAYAQAATAIADAKALKEAHNFASTSATTSFAEAIAAIEGAYNDNTLSTDNAAAAGTTLGVVATGWRANANGAASVYMNDGFSLTAFEGALYVNTWSTEGANDGSNFVVPFYENYGNDANSLAVNTFNGSLTGLENGLYKVSVWVRARVKNEVDLAEATGITIGVNDGEAVDVTAGTQVGESRFKLATFEAQGLVKDGNLNFAVKVLDGNNISWLSFKNVKYTKVRDLTPEEEFVAATAEDYEALNNAITTADAKTLGFEADDYAPYNNVDALVALAAAKAINQDATNAQESVQTVTAALTGATWTVNTTEVNAICGGDFTKYETVNGQDLPYGWNLYNTGNNSRIMGGSEGTNNTGLSAASSGKALLMKFNATYGESTGYTLPLKSGKTYKITFSYCGWNNAPATTVELTDPNNNAITLAPDFRPATTDGHSNAEHWYQYTGYFTTTSAGDYKLDFKKVESGQQQICIADIELFSTDALVFADGSVPTYAPGTYPSVKIDRTFSLSNWATAVYPFAVSASNVAVLDSYDSESGVLAFKSASASTPNVPFLMKNDGAIILSTVDVVAATATDATAGDVSLKGVYTSTEVDNSAINYVLKENKIYKVGDYAATVNPYRAYIQLAQSAGEARELTFTVDGEVTGISEVKARNNADGDIYNLNGQRVKTAKKGVYIMNGKTVIVK